MDMATYTSHPNLEDCPFCAGKLGSFFKHLVQAAPTLNADPKGWQVRCGGCQATSGIWTSRIEAIRAWNRREATQAATVTKEELIASFARSRAAIDAKLHAMEVLQEQMAKLTQEITYEVRHIARLERNL